jgi:hypothetical protein
MKRAVCWLGCLLLLSATACKKEEEQPAPSALQEPTPTPAATAEAVDEQMLANLPVEQDFEAKADQDITPENLESELDKLEKELEEPPSP